MWVLCLEVGPFGDLDQLAALRSQEAAVVILVPASPAADPDMALAPRGDAVIA